MTKVVDATIAEQNDVKSIRPIRLPKLRRAFATIFSEELRIPEIALLSEAALAEDWLGPEEDTAWAHLQHLDPEQSS